MGLSLAQRFARLPKEDRDAWVLSQPHWVLEEIARGEWWWLCRPEQDPPEGSQFINLFLAGRGAGKTRSGSEWIVERTLKQPFNRHGAPTERLIVAATLSDARITCMEGESGVLQVLRRRKVPHQYKQSPKPMVTFTQTGAKIYCFGADTPDVARGFNAADAWLDELIKWAYSYESWYQGIMPALRADLAFDRPRAFVTTTPKPIKLLQEWVARTDNVVHIIRGSTFDNEDNLNEMSLAELKRQYEGTAIGRQELYGEMLEAMEGALFKRSDLNRYRVIGPPETGYRAIVVGVDPSLVGDHDEMGVVVMGQGHDDHLYVIADATVKAAGREAALHCWRTLLTYNAGMVVYEENLGKKWMQQVFEDAWKELIGLGEAPADTSPPMRGVDAKLGKKTRAEPVAMRSEQGRLHMVGDHGKLEDELTLFTSWDGKESPNRLDAMVHAGRHHMESERQRGKIIDPDDKRPGGFDGNFGFDFGW
jgi:phage terminase large subunit-like protein